MTSLHQTKRPEPLDLAAIRANHPLPGVVGVVTKLTRAGNEMKACCPFHGEKTPSFTIFDGGRRYHCFGCGASGDVLDFVQALHGVGLRDAANMLTAGDMPTVSMPALPVNDDADKIAEARAVWDASQPIGGTLAADYLAARGITIALPDALRFASLPYGRWGRDHPCMVAASTLSDGSIIGVQRTYLRPDGRGKADLPNPRLGLGRLAGGAVRLTDPARSIIITEGTEDALSLMQMAGRSAWAALGTTNLARVELPFMTEDVVIGADADEPGEVAAQAALQAYADKGCRVKIIRPLPPHKDFNSELQEAR